LIFESINAIVCLANISQLSGSSQTGRNGSLLKSALTWNLLNSLKCCLNIGALSEVYQMAIAKQGEMNKEQQARNFVKKAGKETQQENKKPMLVRFEPETMERIAIAAKRLNLSRSAFVASSTVRELERLERMEA
jgi:predicted HicB family RNase H-like nuclease